MQSLSGQIIGGHILGPHLGDGGMGSVYQAYAPDGGIVALKLLRDDYIEREDLRLRFEQEIRLMQSLRHENLVSILDYGQDGERLYFTMRLIGGYTLAGLMLKQPLSVLEIESILEPLGAGLDYMHSRGILHRDVKPDNVFLERAGEGWHSYLGDFGLSKDFLYDLELTAEGIRIGTAGYMSPEAVFGMDLDARSDVYSLAAVAYEMLLGRLPKASGVNGTTELMDVLSQPIHPTLIHPDFPHVLAVVLLRGLERRRSDRYQSVLAFTEDFKRAVMQLNANQQATAYQRIGSL